MIYFDILQNILSAALCSYSVTIYKIMHAWIGFGEEALSWGMRTLECFIDQCRWLVADLLLMVNNHIVRQRVSGNMWPFKEIVSTINYSLIIPIQSLCNVPLNHHSLNRQDGDIQIFKNYQMEEVIIITYSDGTDVKLMWWGGAYNPPGSKYWPPILYWCNCNEFCYKQVKNIALMKKVSITIMSHFISFFASSNI